MTAFSLGVNYTPHAGGDLAAAGTDFSRIATLGLDVVRVHLDWPAVQPAPERIDATALATLASLLTLAAENDLGVLLVPIGARGGIPAWARAGEFYAGPLLDAQCALVRAVAARIGTHVALRGWDLADAFSALRAPAGGRLAAGEHASEPVAERRMAEWSRRLATAVREGTHVPVTIGATAADLTTDRNVRLGSLCEPLDFISIAGSPFELPYARNARDPEAVPFLAMLAAMFAQRPVFASDVGTPTCPAGKFSAFDRAPRLGDPPPIAVSDDDPVFATYPCHTDDEQAAYAAAVLERLYADGRLGACWSAWRDGDGVTGGIVRADDTEKPVAGALRGFAAQRRSVVAARDLPALAAPFYYRTLPESMRTLYDAFLPFVAARR